MKKAMELSVLCDCEVLLVIFSGSEKLYQYASHKPEDTLSKALYKQQDIQESRNNEDVIKIFFA